VKIIALSFLILTSVLSAETATVAFVGDINFTGRIGDAIAKHGTTWPFEKVESVLCKADYRVGNLESPAGVGGTQFPNKRVHFKANPGYLDALIHGDFNLVSLANNHALDYGPGVLKQTMEGLSDRGIRYIGIANNNKEQYVPAIVEIKGMKIAFFGYCNACPSGFGPLSNTAGVNVGMARMIRRQISDVKEVYNPDFIVAMPHWGTEYGDVDKNQEFTKKAMGEAGVDIIVGAHPHVLQRVDWTNNSAGKSYVTAYSLGNFIFPMRWEVSMDSAILLVEFVKTNGEKQLKISWVPVSLNSNRPVPIEVGVERFNRDNYILTHGYAYPENRHWPEQGPWSRE